MLNNLSNNMPKKRSPIFAAVIATILASTPVLVRAAESASEAARPSAAQPVAPDSLARIAAEVPAGSLVGAFGQGMVSTASNLTFALTDGVKTTVRGTASLAGTVTGAVTDTVRNTVSGTVNVAGMVGGAVSDTVKSTVSGTASAAGALGSAVGGAVKSTVVGTVNAAGTVTGIVADTVRSTVAGTVNVAGAVAGGVGGAVSGVAKTLVDAPQRMIQYATTMLGTPYKWGGNTVESGLDCSGFVREVVQSTTGKLLPRTAREMSRQGTQVAYTEMKPGDLVFFNTRRRPFSHVGIYLGDGRFMHGASGAKSGKQIRIDSFSSSYYRTRFNGARRVANPEQVLAATDKLGSMAVTGDR